MTTSEVYDKISWVHKMPEIISDNVLSREKLKNLSDRAKRELIFKLIETMSQYFSVVPDYYYDPSDSLCEDGEDMDGLNSTLTIWLSGLSDLNVTQIINGLLEILNWKTEYQKWPPKSVMQFYTVCKKSSSPCHEIRVYNGLKQIEQDSDKARERSESVALKHLSGIFKTLGKDYERERAKKNASI